MTDVIFNYLLVLESQEFQTLELTELLPRTTIRLAPPLTGSCSPPIMSTNWSSLSGQRLIKKLTMPYPSSKQLRKPKNRQDKMRYKVCICGYVIQNDYCSEVPSGISQQKNQCLSCKVLFDLKYVWY